MADALTEIIKISQELEKTLERKFGAEGRGLHEKLTSVESKVAPEIRKKVRLIATIRNKAVHEDTKYAATNIETIRNAYAVVKPALAKGSASAVEMLAGPLPAPKRTQEKSQIRRSQSHAESGAYRNVPRPSAPRQRRRAKRSVGVGFVWKILAIAALAIGLLKLFN